MGRGGGRGEGKGEGGGGGRGGEEQLFGVDTRTIRTAFNPFVDMFDSLLRHIDQRMLEMQDVINLKCDELSQQNKALAERVTDIDDKHTMNHKDMMEVTIARLEDQHSELQDQIASISQSVLKRVTTDVIHLVETKLAETNSQFEDVNSKMDDMSNKISSHTNSLRDLSNFQEETEGRLQLNDQSIDWLRSTAGDHEERLKHIEEELVTRKEEMRKRFDDTMEQVQGNHRKAFESIDALKEDLNTTKDGLYGMDTELKEMHRKLLKKTDVLESEEIKQQIIHLRNFSQEIQKDVASMLKQMQDAVDDISGGAGPVDGEDIDTDVPMELTQDQKVAYMESNIKKIACVLASDRFLLQAVDQRQQAGVEIIQQTELEVTRLAENSRQNQEKMVEITNSVDDVKNTLRNNMAQITSHVEKEMRNAASAAQLEDLQRSVQNVDDRVSEISQKGATTASLKRLQDHVNDELSQVTFDMKQNFREAKQNLQLKCDQKDYVMLLEKAATNQQLSTEMSKVHAELDFINRGLLEKMDREEVAQFLAGMPSGGGGGRRSDGGGGGSGSPQVGASSPQHGGGVGGGGGSGPVSFGGEVNIDPKARQMLSDQSKQLAQLFKMSQDLLSRKVDRTFVEKLVDKLHEASLHKLLEDQEKWKEEEDARLSETMEHLAKAEEVAKMKTVVDELSKEVGKRQWMVEGMNLLRKELKAKADRSELRRLQELIDQASTTKDDNVRTEAVDDALHILRTQLGGKVDRTEFNRMLQNLERLREAPKSQDKGANFMTNALRCLSCDRPMPQGRKAGQHRHEECENTDVNTTDSTLMASADPSGIPAATPQTKRFNASKSANAKNYYDLEANREKARPLTSGGKKSPRAYVKNSATPTRPQSQGGVSRGPDWALAPESTNLPPVQAGKRK